MKYKLWVHSLGNCRNGGFQDFLRKNIANNATDKHFHNTHFPLPSSVQAAFYSKFGFTALSST